MFGFLKKAMLSPLKTYTYGNRVSHIHPDIQEPTNRQIEIRSFANAEVGESIIG